MTPAVRNFRLSRVEQINRQLVASILNVTSARQYGESERASRREAINLFLKFSFRVV